MTFEHKSLVLRVLASVSCGFAANEYVERTVHPDLRVLDLACELIPDSEVDNLPDDDTEFTLVVNGLVLDGNATLGKALFPIIPQGRRATVVLTPMER